MSGRPEYENPYDKEEEFAKYVHVALRNGDYGAIHFGPDPRFISSMDQTRWCFVLFNNYNRCVEKLGEDAPRCQYLQQKFRVVTPVFIQELWNEQFEDGKFAGYDPKREKKEIVIDYSIRPSRTRHLEGAHH